MKKLLRYLKGYRRESVFAPLFKCLEAVFELLVPLAVTRIIDVGIRQERPDVVWQMCGVMIALGVIGLVCSLCAQYFAAKAAVGCSEKMRESLFSHIQSFSYSATDKIGTSTLITRMTGDINSVQTGINMFLRLFMRSPFIVFGAMIMAFTIDRRLALIFAGAIALLAVVVFGIMLISIPLFKKSQSRLDRVLGKVRGNYNGTRVIRAFNKEKEEMTDFDRLHGGLTSIQLFAGRISALMNPLTYVIINLAVILLIRGGALHVSSGVLTQGELVALYNYMSQILVELIKLANLIITLNKAMASFRRIEDVMETPSDAPHTADTPAGSTDYAVCFENVSFRYHETGDESLHNISFSARPGEIIGIIGGTGSGKSTLVNLIPGFYIPTSGSVLIGGKNTALYDKTELTDRVGVVPQKAMLFKGTIRSNLEWGNPQASEQEMWEALEGAQAKEFVLEKDKQLAEPVAQNGSNFSGGQRQRLTVARALLKHPQILILDDSASALDYATESRMRAALRKLPYHPTLFIVSQRTSSILDADRILVLDDGRLVGCGTHEELLSSCEIYQEIYYSQFPKGGEQ